DGDADGDPGPPRHAVADLKREGDETHPLLVGAGVFSHGEPEERLVDGVHLDVVGERPQCLHHAAGHVGVEGVVAGEDGGADGLQPAPALEERLARPDAGRLDLGRGRDHAPVVVREHGDGAPRERGVEGPLARAVERRAVHEGEETARMRLWGGHGSGSDERGSSMRPSPRRPPATPDGYLTTVSRPDSTRSPAWSRHTYTPAGSAETSSPRRCGPAPS